MSDTLSRVKVNGVIKKIKDDDGRTLINELNEKVDNIQVGGMNLLVGSGKYTKDSPLRHCITDKDDGYKIYDSELSVYLENGKTYTISFETNAKVSGHKVSVASGYSSLWIWKDNSTYRVITDDSGKKEYTITWTKPTDTYTIRLNNYKAGEESLWWNMQIEAGNKRTPWTIPLEDVKSEIDTVKQGSITKVDVLYVLGNSSVTPPTEGWQTLAPIWQSGKYVWQKTVVEYADGSTKESEPICITGASGSGG